MTTIDLQVLYKLLYEQQTEIVTLRQQADQMREYLQQKETQVSNLEEQLNGCAELDT